MLPADSAYRLMLDTEKFAIHMAGHDMRRAMASPAVAACGEVAAHAMNLVAGSARARARGTEGLPVDAANERMLPAGSAPAGAAVGQPLRARQLVTDVAG